jgi:hypothetical protein
MQTMKNVQMSMQEIAGFLLSHDNVTQAATENAPSEEMISVTDAALEIPEKRKRGRPPKACEAMTPAERARQYRQKHRPAWQDRRVSLSGFTVDRAEKLAAERGETVASVIHSSLRSASDECSIRVFVPHAGAVAAAAKAGKTLEFMVNRALCDVSPERWDELAEQLIRYRAEAADRAKAAPSQPSNPHGNGA